MKKTDYWKPCLEDSLDLCAKVYPIAARIYNNVYRDGKASASIDKSKDLSYNFAHSIGFGDKPAFIEVIRLYNALHTDHEGGNVSAHTSRTLRFIYTNAVPSLILVDRPRRLSLV